MTLRRHTGHGSRPHAVSRAEIKCLNVILSFSTAASRDLHTDSTETAHGQAADLSGRLYAPITETCRASPSSFTLLSPQLPSSCSDGGGPDTGLERQGQQQLDVRLRGQEKTETPFAFAIEYHCAGCVGLGQSRNKLHLSSIRSDQDGGAVRLHATYSVT